MHDRMYDVESFKQKAQNNHLHQKKTGKDEKHE